MLKKRFRLRKSSEFTAIIQTGAVINAPGFRLYYLPAKAFRGGVTIKTRFFSAVHRNRYRRQLLALLTPWVNRALPYQIVINVRKEYPTFTFAEIKEMVDMVLTKLEVEQ